LPHRFSLPKQLAGLPWQIGLSAAALLAMFLHLALQQNWPLWVILGVGGVPMLKQIGQKLAHRDFGADLLAAIALLVATWLGEYLAAVLIVIMLAGGQALEAYAMRRASAALSALANRMPSLANRKRGEQIEAIALAEIALGDHIVVNPHDPCPVDGTVVDGHGSMDESYLTGEPYQVDKAPGATVLSGAINGESVLVVQTDRLPADSRYATIMQVMVEAEQKRPTMRRLADQLGAIFIPIALGIALASWYLSGDVTRFLAVLVIATPCPLLIAIPITLISAISMAARRGIVIKDPTVLERLPTCRTAIFDKTGTLTYGQPELTDIAPAADTAHTLTADQLLQLVASLERYSKHPLASAILKAASDQSLPLLTASSVGERAGQGLTGLVGGKTVQVTSRAKLLKSDPSAAARLPDTAAGLECVITIDGAYAGLLRFRDSPRADSKFFIKHLGPQHQFDKIMLVSGDRATEVDYLAAMLGIPNTLASQSPEQKLAIVRAETALAPTLFMGDGINDAPALTAATVGIAFGSASTSSGNVTAEAAGAVILENTLAKVDELLHLSLAMRRIALQAGIGGIGLSLIGMGFAAAGAIPPVTGALLQELIDALAILYALRLTWGGSLRGDM
jgi:heavy metal translocating P-type ATPase